MQGLVACGGTLEPDTLIAAYRSGIFPWSSDPVISWWSPDPRAIFDLDSWRPHRSAARSVRRAGWRFTVDRDFAGVMRACAEPSADRPSTWITSDFEKSYGELHRRGLAHSVEVWDGDDAGGRAVRRHAGRILRRRVDVSSRTDASKAAVGFLIERLRAGGFSLCDAQVPTPHLAHLGAVNISRRDYLARLRRALATPARFTAS